MKKNRSRALRINMICGWLAELFALISGLILPRMVLEAFGSSTNGLVNSIGQFLGFSVVLRAGVGAVTRAALFKPLAENDNQAISAIMVATRSYMRKVAIIIAGYIAVIAAFYPFVAKGEHSWETMFTLVLILGSSCFVENFFGIKAAILLQADQKYYVQTICHLVSTVAAFIVSVVLIKLGCDIITVKIGTVLCNFINPALLNWYVRRNYKLDMSVKSDATTISQRWDAFAQQMATVVNQNVPLVLLTFFVNLKEVSVYTIHNMITSNLKKLVQSCVVGTNSTFGDLLASGETEELKRTFKFLEWIFFAICTVVFSVTAIMFVPFIRIYTDSITDVNYIRPMFAFVMTALTLVSCVRILYQNAVEASGRFKQTRNGSIVEVIINIVASLIFTLCFGVVGVLLGGLLSSTIRTVQYALHALKHVVKISRLNLLRSMGVYGGAFLAMSIVGNIIELPKDLNYFTWLVCAFVVFVCVFLVVLVISLINNKEQIKKVVDIILKKRKKA